MFECYCFWYPFAILRFKSNQFLIHFVICFTHTNKWTQSISDKIPRYQYTWSMCHIIQSILSFQILLMYKKVYDYIWQIDRIKRIKYSTLLLYHFLSYLLFSSNKHFELDLKVKKDFKNNYVFEIWLMSCYPSIINNLACIWKKIQSTIKNIYVMQVSIINPLSISIFL